MKKGLTVQEHTYSQGIYNKKILMCGPPLPPPYGGVSVHLQSVAAQFEKQGNRVYHQNTLVAYRYRFLWVYLIKLAVRICYMRPDLVYYHTLSVSNSSAEMRLLTWLKRLCGYKIILVDHDCRHLFISTRRFRAALNRLIPFIDHQILIGDSTYRSYVDVGIMPAQQVTVERAFVPPCRVPDSESIPAGLALFCATHSPVITMTSTRLVFIDGRDLYGVDTALEVIHAVQKDFPAVGLVCLVGCIDEPAYYTQLRARIAAYGLENTVYMVDGDYELWPLLKKSQLLFRPTLSDGASVSEDEAHYVGIPVLASDVCPRHKKTITYRTGSVADCIVKMKEVLEHGSQK